MGEISRQHEAGIEPGEVNDAAQVSAELDNIINDGVNDNWDRQGLGVAYGGASTISINENATRIDTNEDDITGHGIRITDNEDDIAINTPAIALNTAGRLAEKNIKYVTATSGSVSLSIQETEDNDILALTGIPLTGTQTVYMPLPSASEDGLYFEIWPLGSGTASYDRVLSGNNIADLEGDPYPGSIDIGGSANRGMVRLLVGEVQSGSYKWMYDQSANN